MYKHYLSPHTPKPDCFSVTLNQVCAAEKLSAIYWQRCAYPPSSIFLSRTSMYPAGGISASIYANRLRAEGMGSKEHAVPFSNQDFEALKQECLELGCLFEDPCFPAEPPSLGFKELAPYSSKTRDVEWMRPTVRGRVNYEHYKRFVNDIQLTHKC